MIASGQHTAASFPEPRQCVGLGGGEAVTDVDGEKPDLVEAEIDEVGQDRIVTGPTPPIAGQ